MTDFDFERVVLMIGMMGLAWRVLTFARSLCDPAPPGSEENENEDVSGFGTRF